MKYIEPPSRRRPKTVPEVKKRGDGIIMRLAFGLFLICLILGLSQMIK